MGDRLEIRRFLTEDRTPWGTEAQNVASQLSAQQEWYMFMVKCACVRVLGAMMWCKSKDGFYYHTETITTNH